MPQAPSRRPPICGRAMSLAAMAVAAAIALPLSGAAPVCAASAKTRASPAARPHAAAVGVPDTTRLAGLATRPTTTQAWLQAVAHAYAKMGDFSASFVQTHRDALSGEQREESGQLWVKADGRVRFVYARPEPKEFVFDGNAAYFYEPDNAQVTVFEHFADSPAAQAMQFLWGHGEPSRLFEEALSPPPPASPSPARDEKILYLRPRQPMPTVHRASLVVARHTAQICRCTLVDALDNQTTYHFSDLVGQRVVPASCFHFTMPEGVSILHAGITPPAAKAP